MVVTDETKIYCANNLVTQVISNLHILQPTISKKVIADDFLKSDTCRLLYDLKTRLWAEGPDYIIGLYEEETGISILPDDDR